MKRLIWVCAVALVLSILAVSAPAQDGALVKLLVRTEDKHLRARQNLDQILREHPEFWVELEAVAARLRTHPAWLLNVMASESLFVAGARNRLPGQTASGLLQIIEDTAEGLGTTTAAIRQMSPIEQLRLVEKYFAPFRGRLLSLADVYTAVFRGRVLEGGETVVVAPLDDSRKEQRIYALNRTLDLDGDGRITKGELSTAALSIGRFQAATTQKDKQNGEAGGRSASLYSAASAPRERNLEDRQTRSIYVR